MEEQKIKANAVGATIGRPHLEERLKNKKGITLIALIITIIVMLILVGVTVATISDGGLFQKAQTATKETEEKAILEEMIAMMEISKDGKINPDEIISKMQEKYTVEYSKPNATITGKLGTYNYIVSETVIKIDDSNLGDYYLNLLKISHGLIDATDEEYNEADEVFSELDENGKISTFAKGNEDGTYAEQYFLVDGYTYCLIYDARGEEETYDLIQITSENEKYDEINSIAKEKSDIKTELENSLVGYTYTEEDLNNGIVEQYIKDSLQKDFSIKIKDAYSWRLYFENSIDNSIPHQFYTVADYNTSTSLYTITEIN